MISNLYLCPICGEKLRAENKSYFCPIGHCFDIAKSGYVNLIPPNKKNSLMPGDNKDMIKARAEVMNDGYYKVLAEEIIETAKIVNPKKILDAGCGTGYIAGRLKEAFKDSEIFGTDISKSAIEYASKKYKEVCFSVASSKRLPFERGIFHCIVCAFAPVYAYEFSELLVENGLFLRIVPAEKHLFDLKEFLYEVPRVNEDEPTEIEGFDFIERKIASAAFLAKDNVIESVVKMTPYYYHTPKEALDRLKELHEMTVHTEFEIRIYKKKSR